MFFYLRGPLSGQPSQVSTIKKSTRVLDQRPVVGHDFRIRITKAVGRAQYL